VEVFNEGAHIVPAGKQEGPGPAAAEDFSASLPRERPDAGEDAAQGAQGGAARRPRRVSKLDLLTDNRALLSDYQRLPELFRRLGAEEQV
jgi:hypothetical protein